MSGFEIRPIAPEELLTYRKMCVHLFRTRNDALADETEYGQWLMEESYRMPEGYVALGAFQEGRLWAALKISPWTVYFGGQPVGMSGIGDVVSDRNAPERGAVKALFREAFLRMREQGRPLSHLHPFQMDYYRQYGYDVSAVQACWRVPMTSFRDTREGTVRPFDNSEEMTRAVRRIYAAFSPRYDLAVERTEEDWKKFFAQHRAYTTDWFGYLHYDGAGEADAFMTYRCRPREGRPMDLEAENTWYASLPGLRGLLSYFATQKPYAGYALLHLPEDAELSGILECADGWAQRNTEYTVSYTGTSRVVDALPLLEQVARQREGEPVTLRIAADPYCPWNEGVYTLTPGVGAVKGSGAPDLELTPNALASLLLGRYSGDTLALLPGVRVNGGREALRRLFPRKPCWIDAHF